MTHAERLYSEWSALRASEKGLHALDIAHKLSVTEGEMLASACGKTEGPVRARRLRGSPKDIFPRLPALGTVKTVTRNPNAVIEVTGTYDDVAFFGTMGQSVSSVDLRIFASRYGQTFASREETSRGVSESLQFFDVYGRAVHKLFLKEGSSHEAYEALVRALLSDDQSPAMEVEPEPPATLARPDAEVDVSALRDAWSKMTDTHELHGLLRRHDVSRTQALRLVGHQFSEPVAPGLFTALLHEAARRETDVMVFVGNPCMIQIYSGRVRKVAPMGPWINVLDPGFDLHVREGAATSAFVVRKPTSDGVVTSLELYTPDGETLVYVVGKRTGGMPENEGWRATLEAARTAVSS